MSRLPSESASLATRSAARAAVAVAAILVLAACGGGGGASEGTNGNGVACADPVPDQLLGPAVRAYLDGREPRPLRFLSAAGSDSAMPNAGMLVLQDRGPTYFYPPDSAGRETVRQRLGETYWPSLLVTYHGVEREGDESANVRLGGTWISGEMDGESAGYEDVGFLCRSGRWVPVDSVIPPPDDSLQRRPSA